MDDTLYRLRRTTDMKWYGRRPRFADDDGCWRPEAGRYMTRKAVNTVLKGFNLNELADIEIVPYTITEGPFPLEAYRIKINQGHCGKCGELIVSTHRHHYAQCKCGAAAVDGGIAYLRRCGAVKDCSVYEPNLISGRDE